MNYWRVEDCDRFDENLRERKFRHFYKDLNSAGQGVVVVKAVVDVWCVIGFEFKLAIENSLRGELAVRNLNQGSRGKVFICRRTLSFKQEKIWGNKLHFLVQFASVWIWKARTWS